ncbi:MAG: hypothetical protein ABJA67_00880, partial [Chthonomonadales bacterium]
IMRWKSTHPELMNRIRTQLSIVLLLAGASATTLGQTNANVPVIGPSLSTGQLVSDIFLGRNVVGPYILSWAKIEPGSEMIFRGATRLTSNVDYKLDPNTGSLVFTSPLKTRDIVRVDFRCIPGQSKQNSAAAIQPIQFNLLDMAAGALSFNAYVRPDAAALGAQTASNPASLLLGLQGATKLAAGSNFTSRIYLDTRGGSLTDRTGLQLMEKSAHRYGTFSMGFTRAGAGFKPVDDAVTTAGKQTLDIQGALKPIHGIAASASFVQNHELPSAGKGNIVTALTEKLGGTLGSTTRFQAIHSQTVTNASDGSNAIKTASRLQIDQKVGAKTNVTALVDQSAQDGTAGHVLNKSTSLAVKSQPTENVSVLGTFKNSLLATGNEDSSSIKVEAAATKQLKLSALMGDRFTKDAVVRSREANLNYALSPAFTVATSLKLLGDGKTDSFAKGVSATAKPTKFVEVAGGIKLRDAWTQGIPDPTAMDTYDAKLTFGLPNKVIRLSAGFTDNPEDDKGLVTRARNRSLTLQSTVGVVVFSGGYTSQEQVLTLQTCQIVDLKMGLKLGKYTQVTTGFKEAQTIDTGLLSINTYSLNLTHRFGSIFDFAVGGSVITTERNGLLQPNPDYRAEAKVGIKF